MTKLSEMASDFDHGKDQDYLKTFSKRMLKTQLFIGTFQEKRYVEALNSYRDVVKIDSEEIEFVQNLVAVVKKLKQELVKCNNKKWIGITGPDTVGAPVGYNLWVVLPIEVFGSYWFKVKTVEFFENEVRLKLEVVRRLRNEQSVSGQGIPDTSDLKDTGHFDLKTTFQYVSSNIMISVTNFIKNYVTLSNIKDTVIFIALLIGTISVGAVNIVKYLMEYLLKFMRETSGFIKVCSPIIISCLDLIRRTIYGLFALIFALVHGRRAPPQMLHRSLAYVEPYTNKSINGGSISHRRALGYRSSVRIQELDD